MIAPSCVICGRELRQVFADQPQPDGGVAFRSYGNYGSTVFDPMDESYIAINICDPCLRDACAKQRVLRCRERVQRLTDAELWRPDKDDGS